MSKKRSKNKKKQDQDGADEVARGPGRQSTWKGAKLQFLEDSVDDFQKSGDHGVFYRQTATSFFQTFGYDEDYQKSVDPATPLESLKPRDLESIKDEAEREQEGAFRAGLIDKLRPILGNWFRYKTRETRSNRTVIQDLVDGLISALRLRPPRKPSLIDKYYDQYWLPKLKTSFDAHWSALPEKKKVDTRRVAERNSWVKQHFEAELDGVKEHITTLVEKEHKTTMKQWNAGIKSASTVGGCEDAWNLSEQLVPGIADALAEWLGAYVTIQIVRPKLDNSGEMDIYGVQSDISYGLSKNIISEGEKTKPGWQAWVGILANYGKEYFSYEQKNKTEISGVQDNNSGGDKPESSGVASGEQKPSSKMASTSRPEFVPVDMDPSIRKTGPPATGTALCNALTTAQTGSVLPSNAPSTVPRTTTTTLSGLNAGTILPPAPQASTVTTGLMSSIPYENTTSLLHHPRLPVSNPTLLGRLEPPSSNPTPLGNLTSQPLVSGDYGVPYHADHWNSWGDPSSCGYSGDSQLSRFYTSDTSSHDYGGGASQVNWLHPSLFSNQVGTDVYGGAATLQQPVGQSYGLYPHMPGLVDFPGETSPAFAAYMTGVQGPTIPAKTIQNAPAASTARAATLSVAPHAPGGPPISQAATGSPAAILPVPGSSNPPPAPSPTALLAAGPPNPSPAQSPTAPTPAGPPNNPQPVDSPPTTLVGLPNLPTVLAEPHITPQSTGGTSPASTDHGATVARDTAAQTSEAVKGSKRKGTTKAKTMRGNKAAPKATSADNENVAVRQSTRKRKEPPSQAKGVTEPEVKKHKGTRYCYVPLGGEDMEQAAA